MSKKTESILRVKSTITLLVYFRWGAVRLPDRLESGCQKNTQAE